jgi:glyoxylase-like metal-dependent hydrolase (beta-lactamase superfamily II)
MAKKRYKPVQWSHQPKWELYDGAAGEAWYGFETVRALRGLPPEILMVPLLGHTAGHVAIAVQSQTGWLLHCGDAYYEHSEIHQATPHVTPVIGFLEKVVAQNDELRTFNQQRLRELVARSSQDVTVFCAHDADEFIKARGGGASSL